VTGNVSRVQVALCLKAGVAFAEVVQEREHRETIHGGGVDSEAAPNCRQIT